MEHVRDLMRPSPIVVTGDTPIALCGRRLMEHPIRHLPVVENGKVIGVIDDGAVFGAGVALKDGLWFSFEADGPERARSLAVPTVTIDADTPLPQGIRQLAGNGILVVTDGDGEVVGVLSEHDVVRVAPAIAPNDRTVQDIASTPAQTVQRSSSARAALRRMAELDVRHLLVMDHSDLVGVVSLRDLVAGWVGPSAPVENAMSSTLFTVQSSAPANQAARTMAEHKIGCLPVLDDDGKVAGVVTRTDLLDLVAASIDDEALFGDA